MSTQEFWQFLAGVAIFIMGMRLLEEALRSLAGRSFKLFLRRNSQPPLRAIFSGTIVTMILQSSSVVNLLVLAFVGAGVIGMQNGLALILGANLGTTATSWLIAVVGFEMNIEALALPIVGIAGILYYAWKKELLVARWSLLLLGFGLLFTGLGYIKESSEELVAQMNVAAYAGYHPLFFLLIGFVLTSIIQSSSATMAITMSVLVTGAISLEDGMAVALGSEVGTTIKVVLAAMGGSADKKRVALGNFLFNLITTLLFLFLLSPMDQLITNHWQVHTPNIALVIFQSIVNIAGIVLFLPILQRMGNWLNRLFLKTEKKSLFLTQTPIGDIETAMDTLRNEVLSLLQHVLIFSRHLFGEKDKDKHTGFFQKDFEAMALLKKYEYIKIQHGEIFDFYIRMQDGSLKSKEIMAAERLATAARNATYAAKSFRNCINYVEEFSDSGKDLKFDLFQKSAKQMTAFSYQMEMMLFEPADDKKQSLLRFHHAVQEQYQANVKSIYAGIIASGLQEIEVTSALNMNREVTTGLKSLSMAAKDILLNEEEAASLEDLPGFIY